MNGPITPPLVSVCIPAFQGAPFLASTIASVLDQSFSDFELLVLDDQSQDATESLVAGYQDPRIRFATNSRRLGPEGNWNRCLETARGRYVKVLPQDDELHPDCLEQQVAVLEADSREETALVFAARRVVDQRGRYLMTRRYPGDAGPVEGRRLVRRCVRSGGNLIGEPGVVLFRRSLARSTGAFTAEAPYVIDIDYWFRLLAQGRGHYIDQPLATFRVSPTSWSVALGRRQVSDFHALIARSATIPGLGITRWDRFLGRHRARWNTAGRLLLYRLLRFRPTG